jgi:hypothetical protein
VQRAPQRSHPRCCQHGLAGVQAQLSQALQQWQRVQETVPRGPQRRVRHRQSQLSVPGPLPVVAAR